jgi:23S rRNA (uracil1939-C5)-methyltransferase
MRQSRRHAVRLKRESDVAQVEALSHDGRGIAHVDGKAVFIHGALPEEEVRFNYTGWHSQYAEGQVDTVLRPSLQRVEPRCPHYGVCGGCCLQHLQSDKQISYKEKWLLDNLTRIGKVTPEEILKPLLGKPWGYRHKARLGVKYVKKKGRVLVGFRERNNSYLADLQSCDILHPRVGGALIELANLVGSLSIYERVPQIEVAAGDTEIALSFRVLTPPSEADKDLLKNFGQQHGFYMYVQTKGPQTTYLLWPTVDDSIYYRLADQDLVFAFQPYHFMQINPEINRQMVTQALALLDPQKEERILDLFCGLGNFTLPLARCGKEVVGIEGDCQLIEWAQRNAQRNAIDNVRFYAADLTQSLENQPWIKDRYHKVLLDPPRSGALEIIPQLALLRPQRILYISCHPATLARDAGELVHRFGYRLLKAGVMDMFPHTAHVESIALFVAA